ncbi:MAG TPA: type II toxin-antitoxin system VapC family toxin [Longimicrobiaceae bacterium]|nr:type II toxin-antitoxin system VapC family toxin [Longimicrobiaceae bacterium]
MSLYIDTSVLAAYYCPEPLSGSAEELLRATMEPAISSLTEVELCSAVARKVRMGEMEESDGRTVIGAFRAHVEAGYYRRILLRAKHYEDARDRITTFAVPLRSLDALHLAVALGERLTLVTADTGLAAAVRSFGGEAQLLSAG